LNGIDHFRSTGTLMIDDIVLARIAGERAQHDEYAKYSEAREPKLERGLFFGHAVS
jgi:hypothetical protein